MDVIKKVTIKNFRSIVREEFNPSDLTLFVGQNDSGKSNFLRALNLFFNNETDLGKVLSFSTDFSSHTKVGRGKARQIEVWLDIEPPASFSDRSVVRWRRAWREDSPAYAWQEIKRLGDGKELGGRSKVHPWLGRIRYKYVPAIKGTDYFSTLLRDVHDVLAETVDRQLRGASSDFIETIRKHTSQISTLTANTMGLESKLQLPTDLRALFEVLDFETSSVGGTKSLSQRGDGIKVRHISAILKFLSDQERKLAGPGRPRPTTIWGYEEPENNLELSRAFEHADELFAFSDDIQILVSTHSPAFYSLLNKSDKVKAFSVIPSAAGTTLTEVSKEGISNLDESLGLMTLVAPYVASKAEELRLVNEKAAELASQLQGKHKLMILVGGETDATYLATAIGVLDPSLAKKVVVSYVGTSGGGGAAGGGDSNLLRFAKELEQKEELHSCQILVLLDCDVSHEPISGSSRLKFKRLPFDGANMKFQKGIENLLPAELALEKFYSKKVKADGYGGETVVNKLNKVLFAQAVCDASEFTMPMAARFANFQCVVDWGSQQLSGDN